MRKIIIGITESHNASAALIIDGTLVACIQEERLRRIKNVGGFPRQALDYFFQNYRISPAEVSRLAVANLSPLNHFMWEERADMETRGVSLAGRVMERLGYGREPLARRMRDFLDDAAVRFVFPGLRRKQVREIEALTGIPAGRIHFVEHHAAHAWAAVHFLCPEQRGKDCLIVTSDGVGDRLSATVSRYRQERLERLHEISYHDSLGLFYQHITGHLGMKECEHEYKVMGLAPYADRHLAGKIYPLFRSMFSVEGGQIRCHVHEAHQARHLRERLEKTRFDAVAGAAQRCVEETMTAWIRNLVGQYSCSSLALGGGVFMNVKLNKLIREMDEVSALAVCPSCGDESCAIGAACWAAAQEGCLPENPAAAMPSVYLGPAYEESALERAVSGMQDRGSYRVKRMEDIEDAVGELLARDVVVARFSGGTEFGARALGNRSILANPANADLVGTINRMIKNRDFWMPFATTLLDERKQDYLVADKDFPSPYMMTAYDTTAEGRQVLKAGMHPYDATTRPQILTREANPSYHALLKAFERRTGIGGILNTSLNIHGEPMVSSPGDALRTLERSGLTHLALGPYLISKE
jgi:carbamoyltransferase